MIKRFAAVLVGLAVIGAGCMVIDLSSLMTGAELTEFAMQSNYGGKTSDKLLVIDISGIVQMDTQDSLLTKTETCTPQAIKAQLNKAGGDKHIKALLLRINCPGGSAAATELISQEIKRFKARRKIPVYAYVMGLCASGGYHIAACADAIVVQRSSIVGSIGVLMALPQIEGLAEKIGYDMVVIKSGNMKDMGNIFRAMTAEEKALFQGLVDDAYNKFLDHIIACRASFGDAKTLKPLADGRVYTAEQAVANGLVDGIGDMYAAIDRLKKDNGFAALDIVAYSVFEPSNPTIYSSTKSHGGIPPLLGNGFLNKGAVLRTGLYYLWAPGL